MIMFQVCYIIYLSQREKINGRVCIHLRRKTSPFEIACVIVSNFFSLMN
jgi:hypothetical protein